MQQLYTAIVDISREEGGELPIRMNFILDEFANFTKIETFQSMLTVSRSRNCRFVIALQSFGQLEEKYRKRRHTKYSRQLCVDIFKIKQY